MFKKPRFYLPVMIYAVLIVSVSSMSQTRIASMHIEMKDYLLHFLEYNFFGVTWLWFFLGDQGLHALKTAYHRTIFAGSTVAMLDEFYQSFIPGRHSSLHDVAADAMGIILSILTFWVIMRIPLVQKWRTSA